VIKSRAALTYAEAQSRIDDARLDDEVTQGLRTLNRLAKVGDAPCDNVYGVAGMAVEGVGLHWPCMAVLVVQACLVVCGQTTAVQTVWSFLNMHVDLE
jgi:hypothetical protein